MLSVKAVLFLILLFFSFFYFYKKYQRLEDLLFLGLLFSATLRIGYIFYRYNGILLVDIFLVALLFFEITKYKNFRFFIPTIGIPFVIFILVVIAGAGRNYIQKLNYPLSPFYDICFKNSIAETSKFIRAYLLLIVVFNYVSWKKNLNILLDALTFVFVFHSLVSIHQWRLGPVGLGILGEVYGRSYRSYGLFQHPNFLADCLILVIPVFIRLFYFERTRKKLIRNGIVLGLTSLSLFVTFSRGAWIGLFLAVTAMFSIDILRQNFRKVQKGALIVSLLFVALFLVRYAPKIHERFVEDLTLERGSAAKIRIPLMKVAWNMIQDNPLLGVGLSNYKLWSDSYVFESELYSKEALSQITHNSYLLLAAEAGIPGAILYLMMIFAVLGKVFRTGWKNAPPAIKNMSFGIFWGMIALLITLNSGPDYMIHEVLNVFWIMGGIALGLFSLKMKFLKYLKIQARQTAMNLAQT